MQGRFKQLPRGVLYLGGEVLEPTKLGVVSKGLANVLLKFITLWANSRRLSLHCCLDDKEGRQLAHVTMPLWCAADKNAIIILLPEASEDAPGAPRHEQRMRHAFSAIALNLMSLDIAAVKLNHKHVYRWKCE